MKPASMRVLHLITTLDPGGAEHHLLDLCTRMREKGTEIRVAYLKSSGKLTPAFEALDIKVDKIGLDQWRQLPGAVFRFARLVRAWKPDVVHTHLLKADAVGALACCSIPSVPLVSSKHNDEVWLKRRVYSWMHGLVSKRANRVITISDWVERYMMQKGRVARAKIRRIYYGLSPREVDREEGRAVRRGWGVPDDVLLAGTVARLTPQKDQKTLILAFARLLQRMPRIALVLVGKADSAAYERELRELVDRLSIGDRVIFAGFRADIPEVIAAMDLFVLPSRWEGLGLVLLEAMGVGTPIVASRASAIPEIVEDGRSGRLVEPGDVEALAEALEDVLGKSQLRSEFAAEGLRRLKDRFDPETMVAETERLYRELVPAASAAERNKLEALSPA